MNFNLISNFRSFLHKTALFLTKIELILNFINMYKESSLSSYTYVQTKFTLKIKAKLRKNALIS